jgi:AraC-like DNA-binding protein
MLMTSLSDSFAGQEPKDSRREIIDAGYLNLILSGVRQAGYDTDAIVARSGIDPKILSTPHGRLSQQQFAQLISHLTAVSRDEAWALCGRPIKPGTFRTMCRLLVRCSDLREALRTGCHFYHLIIDDFTLRFRSDALEANVWITDNIDDKDRQRMINGAAIFFVYGLMCWLVGRKLPLTSVHYKFPQLPLSSELAPVYEAPILHDQTRTELRFEAALLDLPIIPDEERLSRFLASVPSVLLVRYRNEANFSDRVRGILRRNMAKMPSLEDVADKLNVSPQTLRRRLQVEDNSVGFQELKDRVRRDVAMRLLEKSRLSLDEIAASLGFSEVSTFHRAFRRWTGYAPGEFRQIKKQ